MFRQVGIGAAAVLTIGLLAAGCSEDGDTIITGGGNLLQNQDSTPFSGLTNNNLAPDGGGFSQNGVSGSGFNVTFNCDSAKSDGTFSGDNSAIVIFSVDTGKRVFASYYAGSNFSPPVELEAQDRDYTQSSDVSSFVCVPLNTANYQSANSTPATEVNTVRQNSGNWLILGTYETEFVLPGQSIDNASSIGKGKRRTIGSWIFLKDENSNSLSTSTAVGGITREFRYGFQRFADEVPTTHTAGALAATIGGAASTPATNVMSFGVATDGLAGQATFTGNNTTPFNGTAAGPSTSSITNALSNDYTVGEDVSCLAVVFSQIETTASEVLLRRSTLDATTTGGAGLFMRYRSFNLATMTWGTEARIETGVDINTGFGSTEAGSGVFSDFASYNNTVFYRYMDASMRVENSGGATFTADTLDFSTGFKREMIAAARFTDQGNGTCTLNGVIDVSTDTFCVNDSNAAGTPGAHAITTPLVTGTIINGSRESANFFANTTSIYGADEGLGDLTLFYSLADNTSTGSTATLVGSAANSDAELAAVAISSTGTLSSTAFSTGTNPVRISGDHATDSNLITVTTTSNPLLTDPVIGAKFAMNRTGTYVAIAFNRKDGVNLSSAFSTKLYANTYQTFRTVASTTQAGATGGVAANMESRFPSAPVVVSTVLSINNAAPNGNGLPVNKFTFQGKACYRGWQSNQAAMSLFWEQSDTTGDRVFGSTLTTTVNGTSAAPLAPTLAATTASELTFTDKVVGQAAFMNTNGTPGTTSFDWVNGNGDVTKSAFFQSCDSGPDSSGNGGSVFVSFARMVDATTTDSGSNDLGDVQIYGAIFSGTAWETVTMGTTADSNLAVVTTTTVAAVVPPTTQTVITTPVVQLDKVACLPNNTDMENKPNYPATGDSFYIVSIFRDHQATLTTASGGTTPTVVGGSASSLVLSYARTLRPTDANASPALTSVSTRLSGNVTNTATAPFQLPYQLTHEGAMVTSIQQVDCCQNGTTLGIILRFNNQVWYQGTNDGINFLRDASTGLVNPGLVSNFSSANVSGAFTLECCTDGNGDAQAAIIKFEKKDADGDSRIHVADGSL